MMLLLCEMKKTAYNYVYLIFFIPKDIMQKRVLAAYISCTSDDIVSG